MTDEQITAALGDLQRDRLDGEQLCYMDWYEAALRELRDTRAALQAAAQWCPTFPRGRGYLNRIAQLEAEVARLTATLAQARGAIEAFFLPAHGCGEPSKFPHPYEPMHHTWNAKLDLLHATLVVLSGLSK